jgi:hypothetical protein
MTPSDTDELPGWLIPIVVGAANEGIPVAAIGRSCKMPFSNIMTALRDAKARGDVVDIPNADWPPSAKRHDRLPAVAPSRQDDDYAFLCRQLFRLTPLEAAFLVTLLKHDRVEKTRLHNVVEQYRITRSTQPCARDATDPKMVDVMICKLRKKLKTIDARFLISTIWGGGYHVTPEAKAAITEWINDQQSPRPADGATA